MTVCVVRCLHIGAAGLCLLAASLLPADAGAQAQLNPQELLKQVLPGANQDSGSGDSEAAGERACQRYAERHGLDVRRIRDSRQSGKNNLEVTLSVEDSNDRYEARCIYDTDDQEVRELTRLESDDHGNGVNERTARRAQNACEQLAEDRKLKDVDLGDAEARGRDTVEVRLRASVHGERQNLTCLYDDDQRHAVLAE
jgi:hypothetical protein